MNRLVQVLEVGPMKYGTALQLQTLLVDKHRRALKQGCQTSCNTLLLLEHEPVYTVGIRNKTYSQEDEEKLRFLGAEFYRTNRGGLITFHGPGQLVAYPVLDLKQFKPSVRWYVSQIEKTIMEVCKIHGIKAQASPDTGVWVQDRKICAIGIHGSRYITTHGLALNCCTDLSWFAHIVPCGIEGKGVTSLSQELNREVPIEDTIPLLLHCFSKVFQCHLISYPKEEKDEILKLL